MQFTIVICTWNRDRLLRRTLENLGGLETPPGSTWDVLVVDNNSTDATQDVLRDAPADLPLRWVFEPEPGLAHARNRAVGEATGDWIVWTDDDVLVEPDWLRRYHDAIRAHPDVVLFGGHARIKFEGDPPSWFREARPIIGGIFGELPRLEGPIRLDGPRLPFGFNMAVRGDIQRRYTFDPRLGRKEGQQLSHEDARFVQAVLRDGHAGRWLPNSVIQHVVARERQTEEYLRRWYEGFGRTERLLEEVPRPSRWAWKQAVVHEVLYRLKRHRADAVTWVEHMKHARLTGGYLKG